jgi:hypothetical protein
MIGKILLNTEPLLMYSTLNHSLVGGTKDEEFETDSRGTKQSCHPRD